MKNLTFGPEAHWLLHFAAAALLFLHIAGGGVGIVSGITTLLVPKGGRLHRICGNVFFVSMVISFAIAAGVAPFLDDGERPNFIAGAFSLYLVVSSWVAIKRRKKFVGPWDAVGFVIALTTAISGAILIELAKSDPSGTIDGAPRQSFFIFMVLGTIATIDDLVYLLRRGYAGAARIARHLWRMCAALFFATGSFFLGQPQVFPEYLQGSMLLFVPVVMPVIWMLYWVLHVSLAPWLSRRNRAKFVPTEH